MPGPALRTAVLLFLLVALGWWLWGRQPQPAVHDLPRAAEVHSQPQLSLRSRPPRPAEAVADGDAAPVPLAAVPSLQGSAIDGEAGRDRYGRLRVDAGLRRFFDWHRAASGEIGESALRQWLSGHLAERLDTAGVAEALALYDLYLDYLRAAEGLAVETDPARRWDRLLELRRQMFGAERARDLFADEDPWMQAQIARQAIKQDPRLDAAARQQALQALEATLAEPLRADPTVALLDEVDQLDRQFAASGLDAGQRLQERSALFGPEAAARLAALDAQREDWQRRLEDFRRQSEQLRQRSASEDDYRRALEAWAQQHYDEAELRRIAALQAETGG